MANLNLSEFGEKLFVADADHTFIWDTAASISKRVSRNSWLNSGTLTSDAPVTISQTWNAGGNVMTALKVVATDTASGGTSSLLDAQTTAGGSQFSVRKGVVVGDNYSSLTTYGVKTAFVSFGNYYGSGALCGSTNGLTLFAAPTINAYINISAVLATVGNTNSALAIGAAQDTILLRDGAANTLALRNGANAQTFNVYGTYTSGTSYERLTLSAPSAANAIIGTNKGSGGGTARGLEFQTDGVSRWSISTAGHLIPSAGNTYNIGASGGNSPSNIYASNNVVVGGNLFTSSIAAPGVLGPIKLIDSSGSDFGRLQFGGTTASYPALKRSTTYLQARLADDSAFAPIQGKLTTDTAYTGTVVAATGYITIYDSTGAAYRVPCAV
jgi:hypothetical protein